MTGTVPATTTKGSPLFYRELGRKYPEIVFAEGVRLFDADGREYLDFVGGGAMVTSLGYGVPEIIYAVTEQAKRIAYAHNTQFTNPSQEGLAADIVEVAPPGFTKVTFATGGAEANETALRLARAFHVETGHDERWRVISPAQAYHGSTFGTLGLTGRDALQSPYQPYVVQQLHVPPATSRIDATGARSLEALDEAIEAAGPETIAAYFCEPITAAALPAYTPPRAYWEGLEERRARHGFLICLDEIVTGIGRTGHWFAADRLPIRPDIITVAKGLGAGYAPVSAVLCRDEVYAAIAAGSGSFEHGHTWNGAPLGCAVGRAVIEYIRRNGLVDRVAEEGPRLLAKLRASLDGLDIVGDVRGHGFLLGVEYVDPRDRTSFPDPALRVGRRIDLEALARGLVVYSTQPTADGYAADQTILAPAFTTSEDDLDLMVERFATSIAKVEAEVKRELAAR